MKTAALVGLMAVVPPGDVAPVRPAIDLLRHTLEYRAGRLSGAEFAYQRLRTHLRLQPGMVGGGPSSTPGHPSLALWSRLNKTDANRAVVEALEIHFAPLPSADAPPDGLAFSLAVVEDQLAAGGFVGTACQCFCDAECDDAVFCNGAEICSSGACFAGSPPSCNDGNPCTTDACDPGLNGCLHDPVPPPGEIANLQVTHPNPALPTSELTWDPQAGTTRYNIYRAMTFDLADLACFAMVPMPGGTDGDPLPAGQVKYYLTTAVACGESTLGFRSSGAERINTAPCP